MGFETSGDGWVRETAFGYCLKFVFGQASQSLWLRNPLLFGVVELYHGEFDPGSERTLAARFKHASRRVVWLRPYESGERVSNT